MPNPLAPLKPHEFDYWKAQHLLNRAGFGGTPGQVRELADMGLEAAVEHIVEYRKTPDPDPVRPEAYEADIMQPATPAERQAARRARQGKDEDALAKMRVERMQRQQRDRQQIRELQRWWLTRMIESPRPLEEKMTLFWHGHFATGYRTIEDSFHMFLQNQLFRHHATGSFRELCHAVIRDPAMLRYLNNDQNHKARPNENLARELMELFTLGEGNDYTEDDIKQGARALTGWTYQDDEFVGTGSARYQQLHDTGTKRILGKVGNWDGDDFVEIILGRPVCSEFICLKLYRFMVNDLPGPSAPPEEAKAYVLALARHFREKDSLIEPVLRTMFLSEHFYAPANVASQIKSPVQLTVQAIRSLRTPARQLAVLLSAADLMGQSIFFPPSVKGWDGGRAWINTSTLFVRQNLMVYLLTGRRPQARDWQEDGGAFDAAHLIDHLRMPDGSIDVEEAMTYLLWFNLGRRPDPTRIEALVGLVKDRGGRLDNETLTEVLALVTATPEYQLC